jgi:hypothetical protein
MRGERIKVAGISKVNIPTILHPKIPYFVLLLEDENGNKWVQKSGKEYKIGEEFKTEKSDSKDAVAVWRVKYEFLEGIEKLVELIGGLKVSPETKILILPTLVSPKHPYFAENTSPEFLGTTIDYLIKRGAKIGNIKVTGQSFDEISVESCAKKSGLLDICLKNKVKILDLSKSNFAKKGNFEISEEVFSADLFINLPILKVGKASASENLFKLLKKENYLGLKYLSSDCLFRILPSDFSEGKLDLKNSEIKTCEEIFQDLVKILPPILTLAEAQNVQKRDKFVAYLGLVFGSFNSLNLDRVFAEISMTKLPDALKNVKIDNIPILGRKVEELQFNLEK